MHDGPKIFLTTVLKRFAVGSCKFFAFNINLWSIKNGYFWFPRSSNVTIVTSLLRSTRDFLNYHSVCFIITKFEKFSKVKFDLISKICKV